MTGMRTTLLGTKVQCFHPERDFDIVARVCKACGTTDEEFAVEELEVDYPEASEEPPQPVQPQPMSGMYMSGMYMGIDPGFLEVTGIEDTERKYQRISMSGRAMGQAVDQASQAFRRMAEAMGKTEEQVNSAVIAATELSITKDLNIALPSNLKFTDFDITIEGKLDG